MSHDYSSLLNSSNKSRKGLSFAYCLHQQNLKYEALDTVSQPDDLLLHGGITVQDVGFMGEQELLHHSHQTFDNFLTSEILRSRSARRAINLSRLKTETYVKIKEEEKRVRHLLERLYRLF